MTPLRVFSGIQPTGVPHIGNYFGAIAQWIKLTNDKRVIRVTPDHDYSSATTATTAQTNFQQPIHGNPTTTTTTTTNKNQESLRRQFYINLDEANSDGATNEQLLNCDQPIFSIVDVHAYSLQTMTNLTGQQFYDNIITTTASLLALGLNIDQCTLFRQSDVLEHCYLDNVLDNFLSPARLKHMTQFKDKSSDSRYKNMINNSLLNYPILQAADILLYKSQVVPVGADQLQHIELTRDIAKKFNSHFNCQFFPIPDPLLCKSEHARRIRGLRNPEKKMSKSDANPKSYIRVIDEPDVVLDKCKKAMTDHVSAVYYDPEKRPGVSNLMRIYQLVSGLSMDEITDENRSIDTAQFKLKLADILVAKFNGARQEYKRLISDTDHIERVLRLGADKARPIAMGTIASVRHLLGSLRQN